MIKIGFERIFENSQLECQLDLNLLKLKRQVIFLDIVIIILTL